MDKMIINYTDSYGNKIPVEVKINKNLSTRKATKKKTSFKNTRLNAAIAATAVVLSIGSGIVLSGCSLFKQQDIKPENNNNSVSQKFENTNETATKDDAIESLRFEPNSKESIIKQSVYLIEEAARCGKVLDPEDAVLAVVATNSNELSLGFMGELFGEQVDQTYTYNMISDAYLKTALIQLETMGVAKSNDIAFNMENIFASREDYNYLTNIRNLTIRFNNSTDEAKKNEIIAELNQIAFDLCTYEVNDISSPAGVLAMLSLDGMRVVTNNLEIPILHDDLRDEMFGENSYSCNDVNVLPTAYSNRVSDLKLDSIKTKLENAILEEGKTVILDDIIAAVKEQTKDVQISDFNVADEINKILNSYVDITHTNTTVTSGTKTPVNTGSGANTGTSTTEKSEEIDVEIPAPEVAPDAPVITPTITNPEVTTPTEPEIEIEENVTPEPGEDIIDTGNVEENKEQAIEKVENEWEKAQADSNKGSADGKAYGLAGSAKPSFSGKSQYYINAFNASYDVYYKVYLDAKAQQEQFAKEQIVAETVTSETQETSQSETVNETNEEISMETTTTEEITTTTVTYDLNNLSIDQLEELRNAAVGEVIESDEKDKELTK